MIASADWKTYSRQCQQKIYTALTDPQLEKMVAEDKKEAAMGYVAAQVSVHRLGSRYVVVALGDGKHTNGDAGNSAEYREAAKGQFARVVTLATPLAVGQTISARHDRNASRFKGLLGYPCGFH